MSENIKFNLNSPKLYINGEFMGDIKVAEHLRNEKENKIDIEMDEICLRGYRTLEPKENDNDKNNFGLMTFKEFNEMLENRLINKLKENKIKFKEIDMNKIHNLECNKDATINSRLEKLNEEFKEVVNAYVKFDKENLIEELLDVIQMCYGVAYTIDVDLDNHIKEHNEKLLKRGHKFIEVEK